MKVIDLSHKLTNVTPTYPGDKPFHIHPEKTFGADGYNAFLLSTGLHAGTHIDAPLHGTPAGKGISDFPLEAFAGPGVLLDVRGQDVIHMRAEFESIVSAGDVVLLYTGFDACFASDPERYFHCYPRVDDELCDFFVSRGIRMLCLDTPSPDYPPFPQHGKLFAHDILLGENFTNFGALSGVRQFTVLALPLPISAEASLVRAVAMFDK